MTSNLERFGKTALVTGASSGIGEAFAKTLARSGLDVVLVARREEKLAQLARELTETYNVRAQYIAADLRDPEAIVRLTKELEARNVSIDILVNNAGYGILGDFSHNEIQQELGMVDLNCRAVVDLTRRLLPSMQQRKKGAVIIVSSVVGALPVPWFSTYAATKSFDLYFGESLHAELHGSGVSVLTVLPGLTETEFQAVSGAGAKRDYSGSARSPDQVVASALSALGKKSIIVDGTMNKLLVHGTRFLPRAAVIILSKMVMRRELGIRNP